jgi:hypothetical protein
MKMNARLERAARDFARYCGEPWPLCDYLLPRFICMLVRWAGQMERECQEALALLKEVKKARC